MVPKYKQHVRLSLSITSLFISLVLTLHIFVRPLLTNMREGGESVTHVCEMHVHLWLWINKHYYQERSPFSPTWKSVVVTFVVNMETETSDFLCHCTFSVYFSVSPFPIAISRTHITETHAAINHYTTFHKWVQKHTALSCIVHLASGFWKSIYTGTGCFCPHSSPAQDQEHTHTRTQIMQSFFYTCSPTRTPVCTYKNKLFSHMSPINRDKEAHTSTYPPFSLQDDSCILRVCCLEWVSMLLQMFHRVGWQDQGQRTKTKKMKKKRKCRKERKGRKKTFTISILPWVVTCGWQTFQKYDIFCICIFLKTGNPHIKTKSISTPSCAVIWKHRVFCGGGGVETEQCFASWLLTKKERKHITVWVK